MNITEVCDVLNELLKLDYPAMVKLVNTRVRVNDALADHERVVVTETGAGCELGLIGVLNGLLGTTTKKIAAQYNEQCELVKFTIINTSHDGIGFAN